MFSILLEIIDLYECVQNKKNNIVNYYTHTVINDIGNTEFIFVLVFHFVYLI